MIPLAHPEREAPYPVHRERLHSKMKDFKRPDLHSKLKDFNTLSFQRLSLEPSVSVTQTLRYRTNGSLLHSNTNSSVSVSQTLRYRTNGSLLHSNTN